MRPMKDRRPMVLYILQTDYDGIDGVVEGPEGANLDALYAEFQTSMESPPFFSDWLAQRPGFRKPEQEYWGAPVRRLQ